MDERESDSDEWKLCFIEHKEASFEYLSLILNRVWRFAWNARMGF